MKSDTQILKKISLQRSLVLRIGRYVVTALLVTYVLHKTGLFTAQGWHDLFFTFAQARIPYLLGSIGVGILVTLSSTIKWYMLLRSQGLMVTFWRLFAYYIIGKFFNLVLPTSLGGDVVRMYQLGQYTERRADAAASVFVERFTGLITLVLLTLVAVVINLHLFNLSWLTFALIVATGGMILVSWLIIDKRLVELVRRLFGKRIQPLGSLLDKITTFHDAVLAYKDDPVALLIAFVNSLIFHLLAVVNVWISARALGLDLSLLDLMAAVPIILFIMNLPISIGGIGLMEFAYSFILGIYGATPTLAISTGLLMRAKSFVYAAVGGLLYALVSDGYFSGTESALDGQV